MKLSRHSRAGSITLIPRVGKLSGTIPRLVTLHGTTQPIALKKFSSKLMIFLKLDHLAASLKLDQPRNLTWTEPTLDISNRFREIRSSRLRVRTRFTIAMRKRHTKIRKWIQWQLTHMATRQLVLKVNGQNILTKILKRVTGSTLQVARQHGSSRYEYKVRLPINYYWHRDDANVDYLSRPCVGDRKVRVKNKN